MQYFGVGTPELNLTDLEIFILTEAIQTAEVTTEGLTQEAAERAEAGSEGEALIVGSSLMKKCCP